VSGSAAWTRVDGALVGVAVVQSEGPGGGIGVLVSDVSKGDVVRVAETFQHVRLGVACRLQVGASPPYHLSHKHRQ
jgi:hypothetical protein